MRTGMTAKTVFRASLIGLPLLAALILVAGCDTDRYPEELTYPVRTDPVLMAVPTSPEALPKRFDIPGEFPNLLPNLAEKSEDPLRHGAGLFPSQLSAEHRAQVGDALLKLFGTPARPTAKLESDHQKALKLEDERLAEGSSLYRRHCLHCHGVSGDGRGPTAPWINPHPRDFRPGKFKFTSSDQPQGAARKPRREDLLRTLREGIEGTAMPSFGLLPDNELEALASYVIHLSLRGETEVMLLRALLTSPGSPEFQFGNSVAEEAPGLANFLAQTFWLDSEQKVIQPEPFREPTAESLQNGHQLFKTSGGCLACHYDYGRKDNFFFDEWGTIVRPRDLTIPIYRGGRRPVDLYWRIHAGINGANMPAVADDIKAKQQVWDLVNFVRLLPYRHMLPPAVREEIYGKEE